MCTFMNRPTSTSPSSILLNAKTRRPSVCNAAESLLIDAAIADRAVPRLTKALQDAGVTVHADPSEEELRAEFLSMDIALAVVDGLDAAIAHVNEYGTGHTEAIVTTDLAAAQRFTEQVDAAAVMVNASTAFTDGEQFGFGAEIGISTQKLHATRADGPARTDVNQVDRVGRRPHPPGLTGVYVSVPARPAPMFADIDDVARRLAETGYLPDTATATAVFLADRLGKPLLVEGPAGVGKTELARAVAQATGSGLVRLQCYEGVDEARALYEWNHAKQILRIQAGSGDWDQTKTDVFSEEFLLTRPLLTAIRRTEPTVLLIDETDKADIEIEGLLLEVLSRLRRDRARTGHHHRRACAVRAADLQRHPRAVRGAQAPMPVPAHRLPRSRTGAAHPAVAGARAARAPGGGTGPHHRRAARHAAQEAAVGGRDHRLGAHRAGAWP